MSTISKMLITNTKAVFSSLFTFVKFYFIKRDFLDGLKGFVVAVNSAAGNYYKYLKLAIDERFDINEAS